MSDPVDRERHRLVSALLLDTGARPEPGPLLVPLPAVGLSLLCEVTEVSPAGLGRPVRIALGDTMGHLDRAPDPAELAAVLRAELTDRWAGGVVGGAAPDGCATAGGRDARGSGGAGSARESDGAAGAGVCGSAGSAGVCGSAGSAGVCGSAGSARVSGGAGARGASAGTAAGLDGGPRGAVDAAVARLRGAAGAVPDAVLTDAVLVRELLPAAGNGPGRATGAGPGRHTGAGPDGLAGLVRGLTAARDREPGGPVRDLLDRWLTEPHLWRRPELHPMPWHRIPNPLAPAVGAAPADPPVPVRCGEFTLRPALPRPDDVRLVAGWMRTPSVSRFFGQPWPDERWARELAGHGPGSGTVALLAGRTGDPGAGPVGYLELYRPARHPLARSFPAAPGDVGVHLAVAPGEHGRGVGAALLAAVAGALLAAAGPGARVLAEPDARNAAAQRAFRRAGFRPVEQIALPHKDAVLLVRDQSR
ncbi:GNAT family N-acetyltransferase [Pseudonocardia sp. NPDC046786]|uniref:GNAT family N-acetyltransferase n=1 Tax=Pseudonocardia sp. NPDC046786 TaxID=3155471 RepID=UPI0033CB2ECD